MVTAFFYTQITLAALVAAMLLMRLTDDGPIKQPSPDTRANVAGRLAVNCVVLAWSVWCLFQWKAANGGW